MSREFPARSRCRHRSRHRGGDSAAASGLQPRVCTFEPLIRETHARCRQRDRSGGGEDTEDAALPVNASVAAFASVVRPDAGPDWSLRVQVQFLFPK